MLLTLVSALLLAPLTSLYSEFPVRIESHQKHPEANEKKADFFESRPLDLAPIPKPNPVNG